MPLLLLYLLCVLLLLLLPPAPLQEFTLGDGVFVTVTGVTVFAVPAMHHFSAAVTTRATAQVVTAVHGTIATGAKMFLA